MVFTLSRLAEVFGRGKEEDFRGPELFRWGPGNIYSRWQQYKSVVDGTGWIDKFPGMDLLPISQAKQGFTKYHDHKWVLHGVREKVNYESCTWKEFRDAVDNYLGEAVRAEHVRLRLLGRGPDPMDVSGIFYNKPENRPKEEDDSNYIGGLFSSLKGNPKKSKGNGKGKGSNNNNKKNKAQTNNKQNKSTPNNNGNSNNNNNGPKPSPKQKGNGKGKKNKQNMPKCGWCGQTTHRHWECNHPEGRGSKKWDSYKCKNCDQYKHPEAVCPLPKRKQNNNN